MTATAVQKSGMTVWHCKCVATKLTKKLVRGVLQYRLALTPDLYCVLVAIAASEKGYEGGTWQFLETCPQGPN